MKRWLPVLAIIVALATAAFVRPPRAAPAFSLASATAAPTLCCHPERRRSEAKPESRGRRNQHRQRHKLSRHRLRPPPPHDVDLNHADAATLARVPGIGEGLAQRIVAYRDVTGPFESLSDLEDLDGISASRLDRLASYLVLR